MRAFTQVPIPPRMADLLCDPRGYPIPFMVYRDADGRPHFTINEETRRQACIRSDRCSICGGKLLRGRWFVGGPKSAFHPHGAYLDPAMHDECAHYALRVCPYLAAPRYSKLIDARTMTAEAERQALISIDPNALAERPGLFVAIMATGQKLTCDDMVPGIRFVRFLKPRDPYLRVEYWSAGERVDDAEASRLIAATDPDLSPFVDRYASV